MKNLKILLTLLILLCNVSPMEAKPKSKINDNYRVEYLNLSWWQKYNDPVLVSYISTAYKNNQDLKIAAITTKQAQEVVKESFAQQLPQLGVQGNMFRDLQSSNVKLGKITVQDYAQSNFMLPLTMSYEVDIWGENYLRTKAVKKQVDLIKQDERATYIALTSAIAGEYFNFVKLDKFIKNQEELINIQKQIVKMEEIKYKNGLCTIMELIDERQLLTDLQEEMNIYIDKQIIVGRQLGVLTGQREKDRKDLPRSDYDKLTLLNIPESINAEAIQYRPDLLKTEDYIQKIGIDVKVARRDFLPKFLIYGQAGFSAYNLTNVFGNHTFKSNIGVLPSLDLFTGGAKIAHLKYKKLELEKAQQMYEKTILTSIQEINNSLGVAMTHQLNYKQSEKRLAMEQEKYRLSNRKLEIGAKSKLDDMRARQAFLLAEKENVSNKINFVIATVNIYKSIGGKDFTTINDNL